MNCRGEVNPENPLKSVVRLRGFEPRASCVSNS